MSNSITDALWRLGFHVRMAVYDEGLGKFLRRLWDTTDFVPRWHCGRWEWLHGWMQIASDATIACACFALLLSVAFVVRRNSETPFRSLFWLFAASILLCGVTHVIDSTVFWFPIYRVLALAKVATALMSLATVIAVIRFLPEALSLKTCRQLQNEVDDRTASLRARLYENERQRTLFQTTFDAAAVGMAHVAPDGSWLRVNRRLCEMLGYSEAELMERTFQDLTHPRDLQADLALLQQVIEGQRDEYEMPKRYLRKDGGVTWAMRHVAVVRRDDGTPDFFISVVSDINPQKTLERKLKRQQNELQETNANLEAFAYSVSHDLRAPLRAILGFSEILFEDHHEALSAEARRVLAVVRKNAVRMGTMIDSLLAFSRMGRRAIHPKHTDMNALARDAFDLALDAAGERAIQVDLQDLPPAEVDPALFSQVWINLATNAVKYTQERQDAQIEVGAEVDGVEARYYVRDNGAGFDPAHADKLFGVFSRLHSGERFEGSGVGLAIVHNIVRRHGGRVWAEGERDRGAVFWFALPHETSE